MQVVQEQTGSVGSPYKTSRTRGNEQADQTTSNGRAVCSAVQVTVSGSSQPTRMARACWVMSVIVLGDVSIVWFRGLYQTISFSGTLPNLMSTTTCEPVSSPALSFCRVFALTEASVSIMTGSRLPSQAFSASAS